MSDQYVVEVALEAFEGLDFVITDLDTGDVIYDAACEEVIYEADASVQE